MPGKTPSTNLGHFDSFARTILATRITLKNKTKVRFWRLDLGALKKGVTQIGYDQEEYYFFKKEQELIDKMKKRSHLTLIKGGKDDKAAPEPQQQETDQDKKKAA